MDTSLRVSQRMRRTLLGTVPVHSPLYKLHPLTRFVTLLFLGVLPMFIDWPEINIMILVAIFIYLSWSRVDLSGLKIYLPLTITVAIFMFAISIGFPGYKPDYVGFPFMGLQLFFQPLFFTLASYWRLIAMLFGTIQYFSTNRERDTLVAIRTLHVPFVISYFFSLSLRAAGMFMEDMRIIREAERARGLDETALTLADRAKLYAMYLIPLFTLAIRRTDEITNALVARGYTLSGKLENGNQRSDYILSKYPFRLLDRALILGMLCTFVLVVILRVGFGYWSMDTDPLRIYLLAMLLGGGQ
ncbi:MAG: energy-coupling factor transporter transmembrane component T [Proteobacteria bacterium]|nr:energy-coupling factor transporter transmembrane component T [Pseudomonadota bacterium]